MNYKIVAQLRRIFEKHFMFKMNKLAYHHDIQLDLRFNQYEFNEILVYVEDQYHISIADKDVKNIHTLGDLVTCVDNSLRTR